MCNLTCMDGVCKVMALACAAQGDGPLQREMLENFTLWQVRDARARPSRYGCFGERSTSDPRRWSHPVRRCWAKRFSHVWCPRVCSLLSVSPFRGCLAVGSTPVHRALGHTCTLASQPAHVRRCTTASATTHRISNIRLAALSAVWPVGSSGGDTSQTSPPMSCNPRNPRSITWASRMLNPPGSGAPVPMA